jgi:hypothetical protein
MRLRFVAGVGGTLRYTLPIQDGAPTSATVSIVSAIGTPLPTPVANADATVSGHVLSYALSGAQCPVPSAASLSAYSAALPGSVAFNTSYRAVWSVVYPAGTKAVDQVYEVRRRVLSPVLTADEVERRLPAAPEQLLPDGTFSLQTAVEDAWDDLLDDIESKGVDPDRIMDAARLRQAHRAKTLANMGSQFGPAWAQWAEARRKEYDEELSALLGAPGWYDSYEDARKAAGETYVANVTLSR